MLYSLMLRMCYCYHLIHVYIEYISTLSILLVYFETQATEIRSIYADDSNVSIRSLVRENQRPDRHIGIVCIY